jgi:hypothetical protein
MSLVAVSASESVAIAVVLMIVAVDSVIVL